jgi:DNA-binding NarL/FixJ family response regulator
VIRVTVVEDQASFREALLTLIDTMNGFEVNNAFANAEDALAEAGHAETDIYLLDINLPGMNGISLLRHLKTNAKHPCQFLMCTSYDDEDYVFEALKAGAHGYILKNSSPQEVMAALRDLANGGAPMSSAIARKVIANFHRRDQGHDVKDLVSPRELQVLELLSKGHIYKEVAAQLGISTETVRKHCYTIYEKLHVDNRVEAVNKYLGR